MSIINFAIPKKLEKRVAQVIKDQGFASKAEFFRFVTMSYLEELSRVGEGKEDDVARIAYLSREIQKEVVQQYGGKKLPTLEEQLAGV